MINYISIDGFKSLKNVVIEIKPLTILIGLNSSGKSSVLQFLQILKQTAPANYSNLNINGDLIELGTFSDVVFNREEQNTIEFYIGGLRKASLNPPFGRSIEYGYSASVDSRGLKKQACDILSGQVKLSGEYDRQKRSRIEIPLSQGRLFFDPTYIILRPFNYTTSAGIAEDFDFNNLETFLNVIKDELEDFFFVPAIRGVSSPSYPLDSKSSEDLVDVRNLYQQAIKFSSTVVYQGTDIENEINKWIRRVTGITVRGRTIPDKQGAIEAHRKIGVNIVNEGFGSNQLVHLFAQIAMAPQGGLIGIEEPEVHLHPKAQSELAKVLAEISQQEKKNLIIATHSEHILYRLLIEIAKGNLSPKELAVYHFKLSDEGITEVEKLTVDEKGKLSKGLPDFFDLDLEEFKDLLQSLKA